MPNSMRLVRSARLHPSSVSDVPAPNIHYHWGESRSVVKASILGMRFGTGLWAARVGLLVL